MARPMLTSGRHRRVDTRPNCRPGIAEPAQPLIQVIYRPLRQHACPPPWLAGDALDRECRHGRAVTAPDQTDTAKHLVAAELKRHDLTRSNRDGTERIAHHHAVIVDQQDSERRTSDRDRDQQQHHATDHKRYRRVRTTPDRASNSERNVDEKDTGNRDRLGSRAVAPPNIRLVGSSLHRRSLGRSVVPDRSPPAPATLPQRLCQRFRRTSQVEPKPLYRRPVSSRIHLRHRARS